MAIKTLLRVVLGVFICFCGCREKEHPGDGVLFDFEQEQDPDLFWWKCKTRFSISEEYARHGERSLKISFFPTEQVGFSTDRITHNWRRARSLVFFVYNPSRVQVPFHIRISDGHTKGDPERAFRKRVDVAPGENRIVIPVEELRDSSSRALDVSEIKGFYIFMKNIQAKTTLYFDYFKLIP